MLQIHRCVFSGFEESDELPCVSDGILTLHTRQKVAAELNQLHCRMFRFYWPDVDNSL